MYVYWPKIDKDVKKVDRSFQDCVKIKQNPSRTSLHLWNEPEENWEHIHTDYADSIDNHHLLVCIHAKSK